MTRFLVVNGRPNNQIPSISLLRVNGFCSSTAQHAFGRTGAILLPRLLCKLLISKSCCQRGAIDKFYPSKLSVHASTADFGADSHNKESPGNRLEALHVEELRNTALADQNKRKGNLQLAAALAALIGVATLAAVGVTLASGGPVALVAAISKSGFTAAFALIFISELGDKTFFIAALLAMQHSKVLVLLGSSAALALMTVISVAIGRIFHAVPAQLKTTLPVGEYAAVALLLLFGFKSIKSAWDMPSVSSEARLEISDSGELAVAEEVVKKSEVKMSSSPFEILAKAFTLVFVAEWGDRSMLATIALGAAQSPWGVATGATAGHVLATGLAVLGGAILAQYISEKWVGYIGGFLFLGFAAATLASLLAAKPSPPIHW